MKNFLSFFKDLFFILKGKYRPPVSHEYAYAFLVHSRSYRDIYRKYPQLRFLPKWLVLFIIHHMWPITVSRVTGLKAFDGGHEVRGYVIGIPMAARQMMNNREAALKRIRQALYLAKGRGVSIVGLGGLTSSLSASGTLLTDIDIHITTGHAYTAYNITQNLFKLVEIFDIPQKKLKIAIVGAAGSVGSTCALILARAGYTSFTIIDLERKKENLNNLKNFLGKTSPRAAVTISYDPKDIAGADFVITATNAPEALIVPDLVTAGMVILDDAQPSDIHSDVLKLEHVLVVEAGVVDTPGVSSNFNYGLKSRHDNFCCMAELLVLASHGWADHFVIRRATLEHVDQIARMGEHLDFKVAQFQNFLESIPREKIEHIKTLSRQKHALQP